MAKFIDFWTILYIIERGCDGAHAPNPKKILIKALPLNSFARPVALAASAPSADRSPSGRKRVRGRCPLRPLQKTVNLWNFYIIFSKNFAINSPPERRAGRAPEKSKIFWEICNRSGCRGRLPRRPACHINGKYHIVRIGNFLNQSTCKFI